MLKLNFKTAEYVAVKNGGDRCSVEAGDICRLGMYCKDGVCRCRSGHMSANGEYCLQDTERLLGDRCDPDTDICVHQGRM
jgi:uncharacterized protein YodC (DUF2158 family)